MAQTPRRPPRPSSSRVLDLSVFTDDKTIRILGTDYPLSPVDSLSILEYNRWAKLGARVDVLVNRETDHTAAEAAELSSLLDTLCRMVLQAPDAIHVRLKDLHRFQIINAFVELLRSMNPAIAGATIAPPAPPSPAAPRRRPTGGTRSRDSSGSTAATP
jgi:hypothetical protein